MDLTQVLAILKVPIEAIATIVAGPVGAAVAEAGFDLVPLVNSARGALAAVVASAPDAASNQQFQDLDSLVTGLETRLDAAAANR